MKIPRSAATLGRVVQAAIQSHRFQRSIQQISMTTKPTLDQIAIERTLGAKTLARRSRIVRSKNGAVEPPNSSRSSHSPQCACRPSRGLEGLFLVFDFDADSEALAANGSSAFEGHLREPGEEVLAQLGSVFEKLVPMAREIAEVGQSNGDGARVPAIRGIEAEATDSARAA